MLENTRNFTRKTIRIQRILRCQWGAIQKLRSLISTPHCIFYIQLYNMFGGRLKMDALLVNYVLSCKTLTSRKENNRTSAVVDCSCTFINKLWKSSSKYESQPWMFSTIGGSNVCVDGKDCLRLAIKLNVSIRSGVTSNSSTQELWESAYWDHLTKYSVWRKY